jgi:hypothetical protein
MYGGYKSDVECPGMNNNAALFCCLEPLLETENSGCIVDATALPRYARNERSKHKLAQGVDDSLPRVWHAISQTQKPKFQVYYSPIFVLGVLQCKFVQ